MCPRPVVYVVGGGARSCFPKFNLATLKGLCHPAFLARVISWLAFVFTIFMGHENGDNKGKPKDDTYKACWMKQTLKTGRKEPKMPLDSLSLST